MGGLRVLGVMVLVLLVVVLLLLLLLLMVLMEVSGDIVVGLVACSHRG